jgi:small subunit ribosomal protein S11
MAENIETPKEKKVEATAPVESAEKADATKDQAEAPKVRKKKGKKNIASGILHIIATFNNTLLTVTDMQGNTIVWSTAAGSGFKGSKKGTPFAAQVAAEDVIRKAKECGLRSISVHVKGPGAGREAALRALAHSGLKLMEIRDLTPIPHNGCRPPKKRRV